MRVHTRSILYLCNYCLLYKVPGTECLQLYCCKQIHFNNDIILHFFTYFLETYVSPLSADLAWGGGGILRFCVPWISPDGMDPNPVRADNGREIWMFTACRESPLSTLNWPRWVRICRPFKEPGIYSQPGRLIRQPNLTYRPARLHRLAISNGVRLNWPLPKKIRSTHSWISEESRQTGSMV